MECVNQIIAVRVVSHLSGSSCHLLWLLQCQLLTFVQLYSEPVQLLKHWKLTLGKMFNVHSFCWLVIWSALPAAQEKHQTWCKGQGETGSKKGKLVDVVYFDFTKDFHVVSHSTFTAELVSSRLDNWFIRLLENCLGHQAWSVEISSMTAWLWDQYLSQYP